MVRKITRKGWVRKLDKIQTEILKAMYTVCVQCGSTKQLGTGHIFSRRVYETRWDFLPKGNCYLQCWADNFRHVRDQWPYIEWYKKQWGDIELRELRRRYDQSDPMTTSDLEDQYNYMKDELEAIKE